MGPVLSPVRRIQSVIDTLDELTWLRLDPSDDAAIKRLKARFQLRLLEEQAKENIK